MVTEKFIKTRLFWKVFQIKLMVIKNFMNV